VRTLILNCYFQREHSRIQLGFSEQYTLSNSLAHVVANLELVTCKLPCATYGLSVQNGWYEEKLRGDKLPLVTDVVAAGGLPVHGLYREGEPGY
jgi:hypothetical protein